MLSQPAAMSLMRSSRTWGKWGNMWRFWAYSQQGKHQAIAHVLSGRMMAV